VIQSGTVPVTARRSAFSCVFVRSTKTHVSLVLAGKSLSGVGSGGERSIQLSYASMPRFFRGEMHFLGCPENGCGYRCGYQSEFSWASVAIVDRCSPAGKVTALR
jgi:hypothetical protein